MKALFKEPSNLDCLVLFLNSCKETNILMRGFDTKNHLRNSQSERDLLMRDRLNESGYHYAFACVFIGIRFYNKKNSMNY